jgi:hypothetical protein
MNIKQYLPYQIVSHRAKKYATHYKISPEKCVIVPLKIFGDEVSCDIRWEDENGEPHLLENKFFACENLIPLNALQEFELHQLWKQNYDAHSTVKTKLQPDDN